jgi:N utilization substance protein B
VSDDAGDSGSAEAQEGRPAARAREHKQRHNLPAARHRARVITLQALYEADQTGHDPALSVERLSTAERASEQTAAYAEHLVLGIKERRQDLDEHIRRSAPQWPVEQLAVVDRNILRIAIYEMLLDGETPLRVAVNEAVELAKTFGSDSSPRFVNGVLGALSALAEDTSTETDREG